MRSILLVFLCAVAVAPLACPANALAAAPGSVVVSPATAALRVRRTAAFHARVEHSLNQQVRWYVDGVLGGDSTVGFISRGLYQAPALAGSHRITAKSVALGVSGSATAFDSDSPGVLTYHNDNSRTGQNLDEIALSPAIVGSGQFGKLFADQVDGYVYAQPLYLPDTPIRGHAQHDVVYVATEHDSVYALDADMQMTPLWKVSFIDLARDVTTVPYRDVGTPDIFPEIGITGTPVIDPQSGTLYVIAKTKEKGKYVQRLHALDVGSGAEKFHGPVVISASAPGSADPNDGNGHVLFDPLIANQRSALLLDNGVVYIAFASHGDNGSYHGWLLAYDAKTLAQLAAFVDTPNGFEGGIWQAGAGPAADSDGNVFVDTGNGTFDANLGSGDYGDSALKLQLVTSAPAASLKRLDSFTPFNQADLQDSDLDYGSGGPVLLPDQATGPPHLLVSGDKAGNLYVLNRDNLGGFQADGNSQIVQYMAGVQGPVLDAPAYWQGNVYFCSQDNPLDAYQLSGGQLSSSPVSQSAESFSFPGATPSVSANGATQGIVWALDNFGFSSETPALLIAYDATDVSKELYNSSGQRARDSAGRAVKFTVPTVADGKVFVGGEEQLTVYGLLP